MDKCSAKAIVDSQRRVISTINMFPNIESNPAIMRIVKEYNYIAGFIIKYPSIVRTATPMNKRITYLEALLVKEDELNTICSLLHLI